MYFKKFLLITILFCFITNLKSQKIGYDLGIKLGTNYNTNNFNKIDFKDFSQLHGGGFISIILPLIGIRGEILFSNKVINTDSINVNSLKQFSTKNLDIPILLEYSPTIFINILTLQTGPQFGVLLDKPNNIPTSYSNATKNFDLSWVFGLRLNLKSLHVYTRYVTSISQIDNNIGGSQLQIGLEYSIFDKKIGGL